MLNDTDNEQTQCCSMCEEWAEKFNNIKEFTNNFCTNCDKMPMVTFYQCAELYRCKIAKIMLKINEQLLNLAER